MAPRRRQTFPRRNPLKCCLCRWPVVHGGVRLSRVNQYKLRRWWLNRTSTHIDEATVRTAVFCQSCVFETRQQHESLGASRSGFWWPNCAKDTTLYHQHIKFNLKSCVVVADMSEKPKDPPAIEIKTEPEEESGEPFYVLFEILLKQKHIPAVKVEPVEPCLPPEPTQEEIPVPVKKGKYSDAPPKEKKPPMSLFQCVLCESVLPCRRSCLLHIREEHAPDVFPCRIGDCLFVFGNPYELHRHQWFSHRDSIKIRPAMKGCSVVVPPARRVVQLLGERSKKRSIVRLRNRAVGSHQCKFCSMWFQGKNQRHRHIRQKHMDKLVTCAHPGCGHHLEPWYVPTHQKIHHKPKCLLCRRKGGKCSFFTDPPEEQKAVNMMDLEPETILDQELHETPAGEQDEKLEVKPLPVLKHQCPICLRWFGSSRGRKRHVTVTHLKPLATKEQLVKKSAPKPNQCSLCDKSFDTLKGLRRHSTVIHIPRRTSELTPPAAAVEITSAEDSAERKFCCEICPKRFYSVWGLSSHMYRDHRL